MNRRLIYLVTEDWYFHSHRLPMARAALHAGYDVSVICRVDRHRQAIESEGIRVIDFSLDRKSLNPFKAIQKILRLCKIYRAEKPDIVHHVAMKPILYGSIAALCADVPAVLNAFAGLGFVFRSGSPKARLIRPGLLAAFRLILKRKRFWTLFQNSDDYRYFDDFNLIDPKRAMIIRGSGIDLDRYAVTDLPASPPFICVYAGRMIDMKGLPTLRAAFAILEKQAPHIQLWLCGKPDHETPGSWDKNRLKDWCATHTNVRWLGHQDAMSGIWAQAHIALQPTWGGEGLPKSLLEAGACGRAMIASDVSGNREIVIPGRNGWLVPEQDAESLARAVTEAASDLKRCVDMGYHSRLIVEQDMSSASVIEKIKALYAQMLP